MRPKFEDNNTEVAHYILGQHGGNAVAAINAMIEEIDHLQTQLALATTAMGHGYTRGWKPTAEREHHP